MHYPSPHPNLDQADFFSFQKFIKQAGAELCQAQVKLDDIVVILVEFEVEVQLLFRVGGWVGGRIK